MRTTHQAADTTTNTNGKMKRNDKINSNKSGKKNPGKIIRTNVITIIQRWKLRGKATKAVTTIRNNNETNNNNKCKNDNITKKTKKPRTITRLTMNIICTAQEK